MGAALRLYAQPTEAKDGKTRARLIEEAFDCPRFKSLLPMGRGLGSGIKMSGG